MTGHALADRDQRPDAARDPRRLWRWTAVVAYMGGLFFLSAQSTLPQLPGAPSDKLEHFIAYAVLSTLVIRAVAGGGRRAVTFRTVVIAIAISSAYGYLDEFHQLFVPARSYDLLDWAADAAGGGAAAALARAWSILFRGRSRIHGV